MDLMDKECVLNNYINIIKAHIEGKTILTKNKTTNEKWEKLPNDFVRFDFDCFEYKIVPEYVPFETPEEIIKNIRGRMTKIKNENNENNEYCSISYINNQIIMVQYQYTTNPFTFRQAFDLLEFDNGEPFGKLKE